MPDTRFRQTYDYAEAHGFVGGFPNFHQADHGQGVVYGTILLKGDAAEWRDVPATELGNPTGFEERFRAVNDYAVREGFRGGFPNFHQADYGQGVVYGTILLKGETIELRDVPKIIMSFFSWPFDAKYSRNERLHVLERHSFAYSRIRQCSNLNEKEKENLLNKYSQTITHDFTTKQGVNGEAIPNGNTIWLNRNFLNSNQEDEIAQTLIHEMMHCAGYNHIERRPTDRPGDNGEYYNSPPLRAELCIAGRQSDRN